MNERIWVCAEKGWTMLATFVVGIVTITEVASWSKTNLDKCNWNSKGLHALLMIVSPEEFRRVSMCETSKEVQIS